MYMYTMKIVATLLVLLASAVHAFVPTLPQRTPFLTVTRMADATATSDFASAMPEVKSPHERLGVPEDKVALGIDVNEILQYIGTREDLVEKILRDNNKFARERAEMEADKFLMDAEMLSLYINYEKNKDSMVLREEEGKKQNPLQSFSIFGIYAAWLVGGFAFSYIKKTYIQPKIDSGEWEPIDFGGFFGKSADVAADSVSSAVDAATPSVTSAIDTISDAANSAM